MTTTGTQIDDFEQWLEDKSAVPKSAAGISDYRRVLIRQEAFKEVLAEYRQCKKQIEDKQQAPELTAEQATVLGLLARTPKVSFYDVTVEGSEVLQLFGEIGFASFHRDGHGYWCITDTGRAALKAYQEQNQ